MFPGGPRAPGEPAGPTLPASPCHRMQRKFMGQASYRECDTMHVWDMFGHHVGGEGFYRFK